jgi:hypothetical protein
MIPELITFASTRYDTLRKDQWLVRRNFLEIRDHHCKRKRSEQCIYLVIKFISHMPLECPVFQIMYCVHDKVASDPGVIGWIERVACKYLVAAEYSIGQHSILN